MIVNLENKKIALHNYGNKHGGLFYLKFRRNEALNQQGLQLQFFTELSDAI